MGVRDRRSATVNSMCRYEDLPSPLKITPEGCGCELVMLEESAYVLARGFLVQLVDYPGVYMWVAVNDGRIVSEDCDLFALYGHEKTREQFVLDWGFYPALIAGNEPEYDWHKVIGRIIGQGWANYTEAFEALCQAVTEAMQKDAAEIQRRNAKPVRPRRMRL